MALTKFLLCILNRLGGGTKNVLIKDVTIEGCRQHGLIGYNVVNIKMNRVQVRNTGKLHVFRKSLFNS